MSTVNHSITKPKNPCIDGVDYASGEIEFSKNICFGVTILGNMPLNEILDKTNLESMIRSIFPVTTIVVDNSADSISSYI